MGATNGMTPADIRAARLEHANLRERDLADRLGITEGQLQAAHVGHGVTRIAADPDRLMPAAERLGEVMALTRNESCVIEKVGLYANYRTGPHAAMVLNDEIDLRIFPKHWAHAFAVEKETESGVKRSLQVFDAAGDAVHKIFLRPGSVVEEWPGIIETLILPDQGDRLEVAPRAPVEGAKGDPAKADTLRAEWDKLTDTHQFLQIVRKLKMNRLGAYRMAGAPYARPLAPSSIEELLNRAAANGTSIMTFVGNMGCIEIHTGPINDVRPMGPWLNVLDPGFNLHLRGDHVAEVWAVTKSTRRGPAISVEAFREDGLLIAQFFGVLRNDDAGAAWNALVADLSPLPEEVPA